jgi:hypothetical protein
MQTDFLVARPSFLSGIARALDIGATLPSYNISRTPCEADIKALKSDWQNVGQDLSRSIEGLSNEEE